MDVYIKSVSHHGIRNNVGILPVFSQFENNFCRDAFIYGSTGLDTGGACYLGASVNHLYLNDILWQFECAHCGARRESVVSYWGSLDEQKAPEAIASTHI